MLLFLVDEYGNTNQPWQKEIGTHYDLPTVSYADGVRPLLGTGAMEGAMEWEDVARDHVHPNDCGHAAIARYLFYLLETAFLDSRATKTAVRSNYPNPYIRMRSNSQTW